MPGAPVAFGGTMPAGDVNGLFRWATQLIEEARKGDPTPVRLVVGLVDVTTLQIKPRSGEQQPVLAFRHVEMVPEDSERGRVLRSILSEEYQERTGKLALPFEPGVTIPVPDPFPEDAAAEEVKAGG